MGFIPSLRGLASHAQFACLPKKGMDGCSIHPFLFSFLFPLPSRNAASSRHCASRRLVPPGQGEGRVGARQSPRCLACPALCACPPKKNGWAFYPSILFRPFFPSPALGGGARGRGLSNPLVASPANLPSASWPKRKGRGALLRPFLFGFSSPLPVGDVSLRS